MEHISSIPPKMIIVLCEDEISHTAENGYECSDGDCICHWENSAHQLEHELEEVVTLEERIAELEALVARLQDHIENLQQEVENVAPIGMKLRRDDNKKLHVPS